MVSRENIEREMKRFQRETKDRHKYYEFDTLHEFGDLIKLIHEEKYRSLKCRNNEYNSTAVHEERSDDCFQGSKNMKQSIEWLKYGWELGAKKLNEQVKILNQNKSISLKYSVIGGQVSVPRMLQGLPTNMINQKIIEKPQRILNVYKSAGYIGSYHQKTIINYGAKAVQVVELLESQGYRVNLYVVKLNVNEQRENEEFFVKVKVKDSSERLNMKKIAFCLANPSFQRRLFWRMIEACPWLSAEGWSGYGRSIDAYSKHEMHKNYLKYMPEPNKVFIPIEIDNVEEFVKTIKLV